jgi:hypothetical protein
MKIVASAGLLTLLVPASASAGKCFDICKQGRGSDSYCHSYCVQYGKEHGYLTETGKPTKKLRDQRKKKND